MNKPIALILGALLLGGCQAHMMETHGDAVSLLPTGDKTRGGVIRYLNTGLASWRTARRKDAENQMKRFCSGHYRITAEGPRSQLGAAMPIGYSVSVEVDQYTYVAFECDKPAEKSLSETIRPR